jgi:hypothetical protein
MLDPGDSAGWQMWARIRLAVEALQAPPVCTTSLPRFHTLSFKLRLAQGIPNILCGDHHRNPRINPHCFIAAVELSSARAVSASTGLAENHRLVGIKLKEKQPAKLMGS